MVMQGTPTAIATATATVTSKTKKIKKLLVKLMSAEYCILSRTGSAVKCQ